VAARLERERLEAEQTEREQAEARQKEEERQEAQRVEEKRQQQLIADKKRKTEELTKAAAVKKANDDKKRAADLKAQQAEKQKAERETREQAQREAELKRQLADEEGIMQAQNSGLLNQYVALIQQHVIKQWSKPASARPGIQCEVKVTQTPGGVVLSVDVGKCNGDPAVKESIKNAVIKASPLPQPPDARLFQRVLLFVFNPKE
jgi:colicin import membrane protein